MAALALEDRVAALEQLLDQGAPVADAMQPTVITVDPTTGALGGVFPGGVLLNEAPTANYAPSSFLAWQDTDGTLREQIYGEQPGGPGGAEHDLVMQTHPDNLNHVQLALVAAAGGAAGSASAAVNAQDSAGVSGAKTIIDSAGRSSFLQVGANDLSVTIGVVLTWPGASGLSNVLNVKLTGAAAGVVGVATPAGFVSGTLEIPRVSLTADGAGGVNITGQTTAVPAAGATATVWGVIFGT